MIWLDNLSKIYGQNEEIVQALREVSLHISPGEIFGIVGPSGAGKSTLIRCINMLDRPTSGSVVVNGQEMTRLATPQLRLARRQIGMIFQHFNLLSSRTVAANVAFPLEIAGYEKKRIKDRVTELLDLVGLTDKAAAFPAQLSGGQKQRVGIARALANQPRVLLSDEATSALDPQNTLSILSLLKDLNQRLGLTILLITHEMEVVKQICDHAAILQQGRIVEKGAIDDLIVDPHSLLSRAFFPPVETITPRPATANVSITFIGDAADQPVLAGLVRNFDVDVNILGGSIQSFSGRRIGRLQVQLTGAQTPQALAHLETLGLHVEVH